MLVTDYMLGELQTENVHQYIFIAAHITIYDFNAQYVILLPDVSLLKQ